MTRRKSEITKPDIVRDYPYQVELLVPDGGLRKRLDEMSQFCILFDYKTRSETRRPQFYTRWCFKESVQADQFKNTFGGQRIDVDVRDKIDW